MINKKDLVHGEYYSGNCRAADIARWNANDDKFYHWRYKFGRSYVEVIKHPEDDEIYDVFTPVSIIENPEEFLPLDYGAVKNVIH